MHRPIRKAVIPAAGFGTRMLPATKSIPKEMLPIVDRPIIDYIVEEAFAAGIEHVVIVIGRMKTAIEDHFDRSVELDVSLRAAGKTVLADRLSSDTPAAGAVSFLRQQDARGLGHAVWTARHVIGDEPFAVLLPDMLMDADEPCLAGMVKLRNEVGGNVVSVEKCRPEDAHKFGIVSLQPTADGPVVNGLVEKPAPGSAPSNLYMTGRYILEPEIFSILEGLSPGAGGEVQLTDGLIALSQRAAIRPFLFGGTTFDCGSPAGFVNANLHMAMRRRDVARQIVLPELATGRVAAVAA
ncbi:MAG: UTP--glucose-1-phosphate uridylyltransferase [Rhizobiaceae bacterium]|nr:UTP--glucose-1-phosphate uridylyltransferase [Rhizobiaceae bacterium]